MTVFFGDNYTSLNITKPSEKVPSGDIAGRVRSLFDTRLLNTVLLNGDTIQVGGLLPAGARVINASLKVDKTVGLTGIFQLGHSASVAGGIPASSGAFIAAADAGGQPVNAKGGLEAGMHKSFSEAVQPVITCIEPMDGTVLTGVISAVIEYVVD